MIWFTADHHFGHLNILKYSNRSFESVQAHDEFLIEAWNSKVGEKDTVYYLGDLTLRTHPIEAIRIMKRLNGRIAFIPGNHDAWMKGFIFSPHYDLLGPLAKIKYQGTLIVMCHYAMRTWEKRERGAIHLYGHSHGNLPYSSASMDVGVDTNNYAPYSVDTILEILLPQSANNVVYFKEKNNER